MRQQVSANQPLTFRDTVSCFAFITIIIIVATPNHSLGLELMFYIAIRSDVQKQ